MGGAELGCDRLRRADDRFACSLEGEQSEHVRHPGGRQMARRCPAPGAASESAGRQPGVRQTGQLVRIDECKQMRDYQGKTLQFWRDYPGEKVKLAAQAIRMLWDPAPLSPTVVRQRAATERCERGRRHCGHPVFILRRLRASVSVATLPRPGAALPRVRDGHGRGVRRRHPLPRRVGLRAGVACRGCPRPDARSSRESCTVDRLDAATDCSSPKTSSTRALPLRPTCALDPGPSTIDDRPRKGIDGLRGNNEAGLARDNDPEGRRRRGNHGPSPLHRLQRHHPEAFTPRRDDHDRGTLDRRPTGSTRPRNVTPSPALASSCSRSAPRPRSRASATAAWLEPA